MKNSQLGERAAQPSRSSQSFAVMLRRGLVHMPVVVHMRTVPMNVQMLPDDSWMRGREFLAQPTRHAGKVQNPQQDQHQPDREFHRQARARWNCQVKK